MADLDVQPKKKSSLLPWILGAVALIALLLFLGRGCNDNEDDTDTAVTTTETTTGAVATDTAITTTTTTTDNDWNTIDRNAPVVRYDEISNKDIEVRGTENYAVYSLGENILFDEGKSTLRTDAVKSLEQISASIGKRYTGGAVRIYGFTDATGSADANKQLAEQRAEAVRNWLTSNGNMGADRLSLHPVGEAQPTATNATEAGRQQNRRVEIVARRS